MPCIKIFTPAANALNRNYMAFGMTLAFTIWGCAPERNTYAFEGKTVHCTFEQRTECGVNLWGCDDDVRYYCLTNVAKLD